MTKKRLFLSAALTILVVVLALVGVALVPTGPGVSRANFDRIEEGMARADVEAIFAGPGFVPPGAKLLSGPSVRMWMTADNYRAAIIEFDENNRVAAKTWRDHTFWGRLRFFFDK